MVRVGLRLYKYSITYRWEHSVTNGMSQALGFERRAWYPLFAHALNFPTFLADNTVILLCALTYVRIIVYLTIHCWQRLCVQDLNSAMLYALLWLWSKVTALKHEKKASMKCLSWLLVCFCQIINCVYEVTAYICSGKIVPRWQHNSRVSARFRRPGQRARRAALTSLAI